MKTISNLRVKEETFSRMKKALEELNKKTLVPLKIQDFRRLALEFFVQWVLSKKEIPLKLIKR